MSLPDLTAARRLYVDRAGAAPEGPPDGWPALGPDDEVAVLAASGLVDEEYYTRTVGVALYEEADPVVTVDSPASVLGEDPDDVRSAVLLSPVEHFCRRGWHELRRPRPDFDVWWYWSTHLDPRRATVNPLLHYAVVGHDLGLSTRPTLPAPDPSLGTRLAGTPRRVCLLAGSDRDGYLDDTVVDLARELSRFGDVYYLADCAMERGQLEALREVTVAAWAFRHGGGRAGSRGRLMSELVGWEVLSGYDEVLLADDSSYLVGRLDGLLSTLALRACDWWAIAASGVPGRDGDQSADASLSDRTDEELAAFDPAGPLIGLRAAALADPAFRRLMEASARGGQDQMLAKYVAGAGRLLLARGHRFASLLGTYPGPDPLTSDQAFDLVGRGVPFLSKHLLEQNPVNVPHLSVWKERLGRVAPDVDTDRLEKDLLRSRADDALRRSLSVTVDEHGETVMPELLESDALVEEDRWAPKFDHWWAFPVCALTHQFTGNERAVFEEVADDPSLKKIVLTRSRSVELTGANVVVVPLASPEGQHYLLRSGQVFVKHGARINVPYRLFPERRNFINLWHGIPLKRFGLAAHGIEGERDKLLLENSRSRAVITSSRVDSLAMAAAFAPLSVRQMWPTGLPRNDFVVGAEERLPADLRSQLDRLRALVGGRNLVLFCPTFKDDQDEGYNQFSPEELDWLGAWQQRHDAVLGVREHMADTVSSYSRQLASLDVLNLNASRFPDVEVIYRVARALVSDYSSCLVDFLLTGRPVISFAYDYERYRDHERGLFYELDDVLPGPVCRDFNAFSAALDAVFDPVDEASRDDYVQRRSLFFDHLDAGNARRVVQRVKGLYAPEETA